MESVWRTARSLFKRVETSNDPARMYRGDTDPVALSLADIRRTKMRAGSPLKQVRLRSRTLEADMLEDEFNTRMQEIYRSGKREGRYSAPLFAELLQEVGGLEAARRFIHSPAVAPGFTALWERKRLDLTVEAVILEEAKWHPLFTAEEIETCRKRLADYGYPYPPA
jgi:hypothetical protein